MERIMIKQPDTSPEKNNRSQRLHCFDSSVLIVSYDSSQVDFKVVNYQLRNFQ